MEYKLITIVSKNDGDLQAWTFDIKEADLIDLMKKYDCHGVSVCGDVQDIQKEIEDIYK